MKVVVAIDSFKGSMSSMEAGMAAKEGILKAKSADVIVKPLADGGEGSVDAFLTALGGTRVEVTCHGPHMEKVKGFFGLLPDGTAVVEMAAAAGLPLADTATTYGVGELMAAAADSGAKRIILGLGGSATNDGGCGAAAALGVRFLDEQGNVFLPTGGNLDRLSHIDTSCQRALPEISVMCDIDNPLCGPAGASAVFGPQKELRVELVKKVGGGMWTCAFVSERPLNELLDEFGHTPVPPYVHREGTREEEMADRERYQTIYAKHLGSVAAPTAGLHFTPEIFAALDAKGVQRVAVTLHVGPGTFRPVKVDDIEDHEMDFEAFAVPQETADAINACKARGGRVFCVGSTSVRTLETVAARERGPDDPLVVGGSGASNIFIYPPYQFKVCDCMLTNFHLPQSTLLMMTSALAGRERMLCAYAMAVRADYRFFSYGDCMLIV